jgi:hypothetical protein
VVVLLFPGAAVSVPALLPVPGSSVATPSPQLNIPDKDIKSVTTQISFILPNLVDGWLVDPAMEYSQITDSFADGLTLPVIP